MTAPDGAAGVFDRAADSYDDVGVPWFGPIAAGLVETLAVRPGERVLDIGCGRGAALVPLAEATGPTGSALGIDLAPSMVARTAADLAHLPHVEVRVADASDPGLPAASYDVVASCLVLFFLPDPALAVRRWRDLGPFASDAGMEQLLRDAGLVDVRTVNREIRTTFDDAEHWIRFTWSTGQRAIWETIPPEQHAAVRRDIHALLAELGTPIPLTQVVRHTLGRRP